MNEETLSTKLVKHYKESRPIILEHMNSLVERNYKKIMKIWEDTGNPVPLKKAKVVNIGGIDYYYIISLYLGKNKNLEWDELVYTFINTEKPSDLREYDKDLIYFTTPGFKLPFENLSGIIRYTAQFLEMYGYLYTSEKSSVYEAAERWVRRNSTPVFIVTTEEPVEIDNPKNANVIGKDYEGDGICVGRLGKEDPGMIKFLTYYPEDVLEDMQKTNYSENVAGLLDNFKEYVKNISYKNKQDKVKWPDKFMLNKYYDD